MGSALVRLLGDLDLIDVAAKDSVARSAPLTLPAAYALATRAFCVPHANAVSAYLFSWLENQVLAALKTVPLGQVAGQKMLLALGARIPDVVETARVLADDDVASFAPGLALASVRHETQYSRLFRS
jgi:urease accessory protein